MLVGSEYLICTKFIIILIVYSIKMHTMNRMCCLAKSYTYFYYILLTKAVHAVAEREPV